MLVVNYSINWYLEKIIDLLEMSPLENQFQNFLVYPILDRNISAKEMGDVELIDCHNFRRFNTREHNRCKYSVLVKAVPDMIIARNFFYRNRKEKIYNALETVTSIEVKEPNNVWMMDRCVKSDGLLTEIEYKDELYIELLPSLFKNRKVILTNIRKWEFFDDSKVVDEELKKHVESYIRILELCGFDSATDYYGKELKKEVIEKRWNCLCNISTLKEPVQQRINNSSKKISKEDFVNILESADKTYLAEIKEYVQKSYVRTIEIITSKGELLVNRYGDTGSDREITSISDIKYDLKAWNDLAEELNKFICLM